MMGKMGSGLKIGAPMAIISGLMSGVSAYQSRRAEDASVGESLKVGGVKGISSAGGALAGSALGFAVGGPVGALIGGGLGAMAGTQMGNAVVDKFMPSKGKKEEDNQAEVEKQYPGETALWFQSLAGCDQANQTFDLTIDKMMNEES